MQGIVGLILLNIVIPSAAAGFTTGLINRRRPLALLTDFTLGATGGLAAGLLVLGLLGRLQLAGGPLAFWLVGAAAVAAGAMLVVTARGTARILAEATGHATT